MQTKRSFQKLALATLSSLLLPQAFAQSQSPIPTGAAVEEIPTIDSKKSDIIGGIANTTLDLITRNKIDEGFLKPRDGIQDVFLTKGSETIIDLSKYGPTCLTAYPGGIVTSPDAPRKASDPVRPRTIKALEQTGTAQLVVVSDPSGEGKCDLITGELLKVYRFTVTNVDVFAALQELRALLGGIEGLVIRVVNDRIVLDGKIVIPAEFERLQKVFASFNANRAEAQKVALLNLVEQSPLTDQVLAEKMEESIAGGPDRNRDIKVKVINGRFILDGSVDTKAQREEAELICQSLIQPQLAVPAEGVAKPESKFKGQELPRCITKIWIRSGSPKDPDPVLSVRVDFVTLNKDYLNSFQFSWRPTVSLNSEVNYDTDVGKIAGRFLGTLTSLFPLLNHAANHKYGRLLKTATVLIVDKKGASGSDSGKGEISESLNIPVEVALPNNGGTTFQNVSIVTDVKVTANSIPSSDMINMAIEARTTQQQPGGSSGSPPQSLENRVSVPVVLRNGETAAIGGIVGETRSVSYNRTPGSSADSADLSLFSVGRAHGLNDSKTQFIVFVTPTQMKTPEAGTEELKRKFRLRR